jgi:TonB family protein
MVPAIAAGILLLAIFGSRLLHRQTTAEPDPSSAAESSKPQPEPKPAAEAAQPQVTKNENPPAPTPPTSAPAAATKVAPAAKVTKNPRTRNSSADQAQGAVVQQVLPEVSHNALRTIHGKVKVRVAVAVDSSGKVLVAKFDSRGPSRYFAERALQAARLWTFKPPQINGQAVSSEWILKFEFVRSAANVYPAQTSP